MTRCECDTPLSLDGTCPTCRATVEWSQDSPWRPFCSERCKLIDLGAWVSEQRAIPGAFAYAGIPGLRYEAALKLDREEEGKRHSDTTLPRPT
jgi:endogenous inhibitor of DNA gyrase (YacG/DUF329 family)